MYRRVASVFAVLCFSLSVVGCADNTDKDDEQPLPDQFVFGGDRSVDLRVPDAYDHAEPTPLLIVLHGYSAAGLLQLVYTRLDTVVNNYGVLVAAPDGTVDGQGNRFWNLEDTGVDDKAYINGLIDEISGVWNVDPKQVFLFGHSNGSFMAYQLACGNSDKFAAIAGLAGAMLVGQVCSPSDAVSVLHIHGDQDGTIDYNGDANYEGAEQSTANWASYNGCDSTRTLLSERLELDGLVDGVETRKEQHDNCPSGINVDLWTIEGGDHLPRLEDAFADNVWGWLSAHAKP